MPPNDGDDYAVLDVFKFGGLSSPQRKGVAIINSIKLNSVLAFILYVFWMRLTVHTAVSLESLLD
jgi:hypothetical protein